MLINERNKLSYINNLMFRKEFLEMMSRDFTLNSKKPFKHEVSVISMEPPFVSTEIKEVYTYYPVNADSFQIDVRNIMIERPLLNIIQVISDLTFPQNLVWPIVEDKEEHLKKEMSCFTGKKPSRWNLALLDKIERYHFKDIYYLVYREDYPENNYEIVQTSTFDPYRMIEYVVDSSQGFETNLDYCNETKWESKTKAQYSIKQSKNGIYQIF